MSPFGSCWIAGGFYFTSPANAMPNGWRPAADNAHSGPATTSGIKLNRRVIPAGSRAHRPPGHSAWKGAVWSYCAKRSSWNAAPAAATAQLRAPTALSDRGVAPRLALSTPSLAATVPLVGSASNPHDVCIEWRDRGRASLTPAGGQPAPRTRRRSSVRAGRITASLCGRVKRYRRNHRGLP
jgi:hypothetical protein